MKPNDHLAAFYLTCATIIWSGNFIAGRLLADSIGPFTLTFIRWSISLSLLLSFRSASIRQQLPAIRASRRPLFLMGIFGACLFPNALYHGLAETEALNATLIYSFSPVMILILGRLLFGEKIQYANWLAIILGIIGITVLAARGDFDRLIMLRPREGDLWVLAGAFSWCVYCVFQPRVSREVRFDGVVAAVAAFGLPFTASLMLIELYFQGLPDLGLKQWTAILYIAIFPSMVSYFFWNAGQTMIGARRAAPFNHIVPLSTAIISMVFLGETLYVYHVIGACLIIGGLILFGKGGAIFGSENTKKDRGG